MNPASRLLDLAKAAATTKSGAQDRALDKWSIVLRQPGDPDKLNSTVVPRRLVKALDQADYLEATLKDMGISPRLYGNDLLMVRHAFSPGGVSDLWTRVLAHLSPEVLKSLAWQAWAIKSGEEPVDATALKELRERVSELTAVLDQGVGLPGTMIAQLKQQLQALDESIRDYAITGIDPISKEIKSSVVDIVENSDAIKAALQTGDPKAKTALQKFGNLLRKGNETLQSTGKPAAAINSLLALGKETFKMLGE